MGQTLVHAIVIHVVCRIQKYQLVIPVLSFVIDHSNWPESSIRVVQPNPSQDHRVKFLRRSHRVVTISRGGHGVTVIGVLT